MHCTPDVSIRNPPIGPREYIYNLLPQQIPQYTTRFRCLPKLRKKLAEEPVKREKMKTMGPPNKPLQAPVEYPEKREFLKKHSKAPMAKMIQSALDVKPVDRKDCPGKKDPLPSIKTMINGVDAHGVPWKCYDKDSAQINWISRNAISAITAEPGFRVPLEKQRCIVDTRKGDKYRLKSERTVSGLEPMYVYHKEVGKTPKYLVKRSKEIEQTKELLSRYNNERLLQSTDYLLTDQQREELLIGLKSAWDRYNRKYLGLASINDTLKGKAYKIYLEEQLDMLKKEVELVENNKFIFVEAPKDGDGELGVHKSLCA